MAPMAYAERMTATAMQVTLDRATIGKLRHHAAFAAHLVGHPGDSMHRDVVGQLRDVDAVAHGLTDLLGDSQALVALDAFAADDRETSGAARLTSAAGDAP